MPRLLETARQYTPRCYPTTRLPSSPSSVPMYVSITYEIRLHTAANVNGDTCPTELLITVFALACTH